MDVTKMTDWELANQIKKMVWEYIKMPHTGEVKEDSLLGELITELKKRRQNNLAVTQN